MDVDATQVIDDINFDVAEESRRDGSPVGFLKLLKQKNFEEKLIPIFEGVNRVGRDVACHVALDSKTLSKEHCCIEVISDNHFIYDLGSSNKSRRNTMVLLPNVRYELNNNDTLTLADMKFVYMKSPAFLPVGDSGSDTESLPESESMLQVSGDGVGVAFEPQAAVDDDDDDDDDDDPSSDILQPTQHAGAHLIGLHNKMDAFVEDSFRHVTSKMKEKEAFADETVLETPPRVLFGANCADDFVPESDSESEAATQNFFEPTTLEYDKGSEREVKSRPVASDEPTQTYSMDFVNETIAEERHRSGSQPKSMSVPEESPVLNDSDIAPTQVFGASVQKFGVDRTPPAEVSPQFHAEKLSSLSSSLQTKTKSSWKDTKQESIACNSDVEETQVVEETAFSMVGGDWKATEKLGVTQVTQRYIEETLLYEDEATAVVEVPPFIDKRQSRKDKAVVRESDGSVINFSPQSASTQVFCTDAETSFLPTLVLETSDLLDTDDNLAPTPPFPSAAVSLSSKVVRCTGLNSETSQTSTDDVCTQAFSGKEVGQILAEPSADDLCTQVYEDIDLQLGGSGEAMAKSSASTDDICTQVYQDRDVNHGGGSGAATATSTACTDSICSQDYGTNRSPNVALERLEPVSSTTYPRATDPSTPILLQDATVTFDANRIAATTGTVDLNEISEQGVSTNFLPTLPYQAELFTVESKGIRSLVSESAIPLTADDRDSNNTDELATQVLDVQNVVQKSKGKRRKEVAQPNAEYFSEGKKFSAVDSDVSASLSATKKSANLKQGKNSKLSSRRSSVMQSKAETINPDEEAKGHSSNDSNQPCSDFSGIKRNETSEQEISKNRNVTKRVGGKPLFAEKAMNSDVSDDSRKSDEIYPKASGRRVSMRQNKGKRPEDNEFLKPSEEKRKNKKGGKRQAEELQPSGAESSSTPTCSDPEETPFISKSSSSEVLDSQSARGSRSSEIVDSSQLSDDDLPSLASLVALNRVPCTATRNTVSKGHEPRSAMIAEVENVEPVGEPECEKAKGMSIDVTEDEIMKKESGNVKKTRWESERNQRTETQVLSEEDSTVEGKDPTTYNTTKKEPRTLKRMSLGSKKSQATEKTVISEDDVPFKDKNYLKKPGNRKKMGVGSEIQRKDETTKMHSDDDDVAEQAKADGGISCDSASERDLSEGAVDVKAGQKTKPRGLACRQKQLISDSVTDNDNAELNEKNGGHQRRKNAKKPTMEKSVVKENEGHMSEVVVSSDETGSSKKSHLSSEAKGDSKLSSDFDIESVQSTSSDHSGKGRHRVRTAVTSNDNEAAGLTHRKSSKHLAANTISRDKIVMDIDTAIESKTSGWKSPGTLAGDVNVVKGTIEEVPRRSRLRKKSLGTHVAELKDDLLPEEVNEDLQKTEQSQPLRELDTDSAELASVEATKRTARARKNIAESEFSVLSLKKMVKTDSAAAAADSKETEEKNSEIKLLTSVKKGRRTGTRGLADEGLVIESSKEVESKQVDGPKSKIVSAREVVDDHDAQKSIDVKKSMTRKSCRGLFTENDNKTMRKLSGSESSSSSVDKMSDKILQTEDADEKDERPESKLSTKKTNRRTVAAEKDVDAVERAAKPVRADTGSRRVKRTELKGVEEELSNESHEAAEEATLMKRSSRNLITSQVVVSIEKPQLPVIGEVEKASDQRPGAGRKRKNHNTLNEDDEKGAANVNVDLGVDSKRLRIPVKPVKDDPRGNEKHSSHVKPDEQVTTAPDLTKGAKRRTKSGLEPVIKPKVMFTGVVDENGQKTVKSLGGEMVESIYDCTHLVTDQVRRTVKFLCGVARGLSIVSPLWLDDSRTAGRFLEPECFLIIDIENEKKFNFRLGQTLKEAAKRPLLQGLSIHVTENVRPDPTQMKDIIHCAGGKFVPELPRSFEDNLIIVTCEGKDLESCRRSEELGIPLVSSEYIMTGILQHRLDANLFRLSTKKTPETSKRNKPETLPGSRKKQKK